MNFIRVNYFAEPEFLNEIFLQRHVQKMPYKNTSKFLETLLNFDKTGKVSISLQHYGF